MTRERWRRAFAELGTIQNLVERYGIFYFLLSAHFAIGILLALNLSPGPPFGGPDEPLHRDLVDFLKSEGSWPDFDNPLMARYSNGSNYSTTSNIAYWLYAIGDQVFGNFRIAAIFLYAGLMFLIMLLYHRSTLAGLMALAGIIPQVVFVFSYINTDAWAFLVSSSLGVASAAFIMRPTERHLYALFGMAGLCLTARHDTWIYGFCTLVYTIMVGYSAFRRMTAQTICNALAIGIACGIWWPINSFIHNNGDFIGIRSSYVAAERFGNGATQGRPLSEIAFLDFFEAVSKSFYGVWGFLNTFLPAHRYAAMGMLGVGAVVMVLLGSRIRWRLIGGLFVVNFILLLSYCVNFDYQPQGRYLFGFYAIGIGFISYQLVMPKVVPHQNRAVALVLIALLICCGNLWNSFDLLRRLNIIQKTSSVRLEKLQPLPGKRPEVLAHLDFIGAEKMPDGTRSWKSDHLAVNGWAYVPSAHKSPDDIRIVLKGQTALSAEVDRLIRRDVATAHNNAMAVDVGFSAKIPFHRHLRKGEIYALWLMLTIDDEVILHDTGEQIRFY